MAKQEAKQCMFGPIAVVAARGVRRSKKRAMTAVICLDISNVRIRKDQLVRPKSINPFSAFVSNNFTRT